MAVLNGVPRRLSTSSSSGSACKRRRCNRAATGTATAPTGGYRPRQSVCQSPRTHDVGRVAVAFGVPASSLRRGGLARTGTTCNRTVGNLPLGETFCRQSRAIHRSAMHRVGRRDRINTGQCDRRRSRRAHAKRGQKRNP